MSFATWKKEFYPRDADEPMKVKTAIKHSIKKWEGLSKANLKKHGLEMTERSIYEQGIWCMTIDSTTCALCHLFVEKDGHCHNCPLYKSLGQHQCDGYTDKGTGPYNAILNSNPRPMQKALKKTLKQYEAGELK